MGNSNRKNVVKDRNDSYGAKERQSAASTSSKATPRRSDQSEPVVVLDTRRRAAGAKAEAGKLAGRIAMGRPSKEIGEQIGKELRGLYADVIAQPVPERFLDLLNQLEAKTISIQTTSKSPGER